MPLVSAQLQQLMAELPSDTGFFDDHNPKFIDFCRKAVPLLSDATNDFAPSQLVILLNAATASAAKLRECWYMKSWRQYFVNLDADLKVDSLPHRNQRQTELTPFLSAWTSAALKVADQFSIDWFETVLHAHTKLEVVPDKRLVAKAEQCAVAQMCSLSIEHLLELLKRFGVEEKAVDRHRLHAPSDDFMCAWYACALGKLSKFSTVQLMEIMDTHYKWEHRPSDEFWQHWLAEAVLRFRANPSKRDVDMIFFYQGWLIRVAMPEVAFLGLASTLDFDNLEFRDCREFFLGLRSLRLAPSPAISEFLQQRLALVEAKADTAQTYEITSLFLNISELPLRPSDAFIKRWRGMIMQVLGVSEFEQVLVVHAKFGLALPPGFLDTQCASLTRSLPKFLLRQPRFISCEPGDNGYEYYTDEEKPKLSGLLFALTKAGQSIESPAVAEQFFGVVEAYVENDGSCEKYRCQSCLEVLRKRYV